MVGRKRGGKGSYELGLTREQVRIKRRRVEKQRRLRRMALINKIKGVPCMDCDQNFPSYCMDFDHRDPATKLDTVARIVAGNNPIDVLLAEIAKCDIVCSNCHRIRTHGKVG